MTEEEIHTQYDLCEFKAEQRNLLLETLLPRLQDALDAVEIDAPHVAVSRIKAAIRELKEF